MFDALYMPLLLAQQAAPSPWVAALLKVLTFLVIVALAIGVPILLGSTLARWLRMRGYGWKLSLIFITISVALLIIVRSVRWDEQQQAYKFHMPMGVDLKGGVVLIYEIDLDSIAGDKSEQAARQINRGDLVQAITNRINPSGTKEIVVRPYGERQVEIIIPEVDKAEVDTIKQRISTAGMLEFRIMANTNDHQAIIGLAEEQAQSPDPARRISKFVVQPVRDETGAVHDQRVGFWARGKKDKLKAGDLEGNIVRNAASGELLDVASLPPPRDRDELLEGYLKEIGLEDVDFLVATDDGADVTGDYLGMVAPSVDEYMSPCVTFRLTGEGVSKFQYLTSSNLPDMDRTPPFYRHLAIILDEQLISFPRLITTISDSGRITGHFSPEEVDFLVGILRAGKLPATLKKVPISENQIGSMLGDDTIRKGTGATLIALAAVLLFMAVYYRFSGLVACGALIMNLLFVFAIMIMLNAPLTLPGIAGLALTVGMAVDSNVLIFERLREEMARGTGLRMAIRNGFDRATTTIIDSNLTTVITGIVLYAVGTDQLRGFAVTLILGLMTSMFTAVFCSRVVFDIFERRGWIKSLYMMRFIGKTNFDFIGKCGIALTASSVLILIGMAALFVRGREILDTDLAGGVSVHMLLRESMSPDEVRARLTRHFEDATPPVSCTVNTVGVADHPENSVYKIDANLDSSDALEDAIQQAFRDKNGNSFLLMYTMDYSDVRQVTKDQRPADQAPTPGGEAAKPDTEADKPDTEADKPDAGEAPAPAPPVNGSGASLRGNLPPDSLLAWAGATAQDTQEPPAETPPAQEPPASATPHAPADAAAPAPAPVEQTPAPSDVAAKTPPETAATPSAQEVKAVAYLTFGDEISAPTLRDKLTQIFFVLYPLTGNTSAGDAPLAEEVPGLYVDPQPYFTWDQTSRLPSKTWHVQVSAPVERLEAVLQRMKQELTSTPVFPSSSSVGGQVAGNMRDLAIMALLASWLGIIVYVWVRFQNLVFGLAAVIALVHDVLITVAAIAVSAYLTGALGFLLIDDFKINLTIVAALLTIIGYSINDTIVIYDRVREMRGKSPKVTPEMINTAINETLARTILTAWTVLLVTLILYFFGGAGLHGFAFAMTVGTITGAYSTVYIAAPLVLWMLKKEKKPAVE